MTIKSATYSDHLNCSSFALPLALIVCSCGFKVDFLMKFVQVLVNKLNVLTGSFNYYKFICLGVTKLCINVCFILGCVILYGVD